MNKNHLQERAEAVGHVISKGDKLAKHLGVTLEEIRPGYARCTMVVRADMSNSAEIGHGGATFTLAD
ncbi:MAG: phenylacetic acid degradation protein PaaD, partial [Rhodospirillales bacterium]|nr:phenylacetic acid degradation protein PaaD [Rhodospirillales bacterium]